MTRWLATVMAVAVLSAFGAAGAGGSISAPGHDALAAQAQRVAVEFFRSQNERRYDDLCGLFSRAFYRSHALRDERTCAAVLRVASVWNARIEFRIGKVVHDGDRLVVQAVADGAPGRLVLVREDGSLKILAVEGA